MPEQLPSGKKSQLARATREQLPNGKQIQLAVAIAQGKSIGKWARQNQVSMSTAYRWSSDPAVRRSVDSCRRRALNQAIGRMGKHAPWATDQ